MIYYLSKYILIPTLGFDWSRLATYLTFRSIFAAITAFLLLLLFGNRRIQALYRHGARDTVHDYGLMDPESKRGTPTMGGIMLVGAVFFAGVLWGDLTNPFVQWSLAAMLWFGAIGFMDDYLKISHQDSRRGMSQPIKLALQGLFGLVFMLVYLSDWGPLAAERVQLLQRRFRGGCAQLPLFSPSAVQEVPGGGALLVLPSLRGLRDPGDY